MVSGGSAVASILQGTTSVLSVLAAGRAASAEASALEADAADAETGQTLESLQATERRTSILADLTRTLGEIDVATAASGLEAGFGSSAAARKDAQRSARLALDTSNATAQGRMARLAERAGEKRRTARDVRAAGRLDMLGRLGRTGLSILDRG